MSVNPEFMYPTAYELMLSLLVRTEAQVSLLEYSDLPSRKRFLLKELWHNHASLLVREGCADAAVAAEHALQHVAAMQTAEYEACVRCEESTREDAVRVYLMLERQNVDA